MDYIFDKEKIGALLSDFCVGTGLVLTLYDANFKNIASSGKATRFCEYVWAHRKPLPLCTVCDVKHLKIASERKTTYLYTCHAGIMETITPVFYEDTLIALIQLGQFRDEAGEYSTEEKVKDMAKHAGLDEKKTVELYKTIPVVSEEKLQAVLRLLDTLIIAFWEKGLIYADRSMLSIRIERYVASHLTEDLQIDDLCKEFFISRNALYRLFKTQFHLPVKEYVLQKRIRHAKKVLLQQPQLSVAEVAALCGFSDCNYFIRIFKKMNEITPLQFKKSAAKRQIK